ncbi:MAG: hypothetical protein AMXMBFR4_19870 [Candidatus Hydrogenedentota bacterium]
MGIRDRRYVVDLLVLAREHAVRSQATRYRPGLLVDEPTKGKANILADGNDDTG